MGTKQVASNDFHRTILTEQSWIKILRLYSDTDSPMSIPALAKRFGVSYETMWQGLKARMQGSDVRKRDRTELVRVDYASTPKVPNPRRPFKRSQKRLTLKQRRLIQIKARVEAARCPERW